MATFGLEKVLRDLPEYKNKISKDIESKSEHKPIADVLRGTFSKFDSLIKSS